MNRKMLLRVATVMLITLSSVGMASAQSTYSTDYALSEEVSNFDTVSSEVYLNFGNISDEFVKVEFYRDGNVVETVEDVSLDANGEEDVQLSQSRVIDRVAVYTETSSPSDVNSLTVSYDYSGSDTTNVTNYASSTSFNTFTVEEGSNPITFITKILPWIIVIAIIGMFTDM